jgi:NTE family protein
MKSVELVLGSGGARGLSFLGALRVLHEAGIQIGQVIGSSMGAILGAAFCAGVPIDILIRRACQWRWRHFVSLDLLGPSVFSHQSLRSLVEQFVPVCRFDQLVVPLTVVCTDIQTGERVTFSTGDLISPVVASSIAAGVFDPVFHEGRFLVDGGYSDPVPAQLCDTGLVRLVVDPSTRPTRKVEFLPTPNIRNLVRTRSILSQAIKAIDILIFNFAAERNRDCKGVYVFPELGDRGFYDFRNLREAVSAGEKAMRAKLGELWKAIREENNADAESSESELTGRAAYSANPNTGKISLRDDAKPLI